MKRIVVWCLLCVLLSSMAFAGDVCGWEAEKREKSILMTARESVGSSGGSVLRENYSQRLREEDKEKRKYSVLLKGNYDFPGGYTTISGTELGGLDVKQGISFSGEFVYSTQKFESVMIGIGVEYQIGRVLVREPSGGKFSFIPVYATIYLLPFRNSNRTEYFVQLELGRNFHTGDDEYQSYNDSKGGGHLGVGVGGIVREQFLFEGKLAFDSGQRISKDPKRRDPFGVLYGKFSVTIGAMFDM